MEGQKKPHSRLEKGKKKKKKVVLVERREKAHASSERGGEKGKEGNGHVPESGGERNSI